MQVVSVWKDKIFKSNEDGSERAYLSEPIPAALAAKTMQVYLLIGGGVDSNTQVKITWGHSPDGVRYVKEESTAIVDSGTAEDNKAYDGDNGSTLMGAFVRLRLTVEDTGASALKTCPASVYCVFKPF